MDKAEPIQLERLLERRAEMEAEFQKGQALLQQQKTAVDRTWQTMMAIQGALTLLSELLAEASPEPKIVKVDRMRARKNGSGDDAGMPESVS